MKSYLCKAKLPEGDASLPSTVGASWLGLCFRLDPPAAQKYDGISISRQYGGSLRVHFPCRNELGR